jgi:phage terminase small subunit
MARQTRSKKSTVANSVITFQSANDLPHPTEILDEREMTYFHRIIKSREISTWSDHDIAIATNLAMTQIQYLDAMKSVKEQGRTTINERGTPVINPETAALNQLSSSVRAFTAVLGLSASQRGVSGAKQTVRNQAELNARKVLERVAEDDYL